MSALAVGGRIGHGAPERVAVVLGVALVGVALTTVVLLLATARTPAPSYEIWRELAPLDLLMCLVYGPVGALIVVRSRHAVGWAFLVIGWGYAVTAAGIAWTLTATAQPAVPGEAWANPVILAGWTSSTLLVLLALPWLLTPEPPRGWARVGVAGGAVVAAAATVLRLLQQVPGGPPHPLTGGGAVSEAALRVDGALIPIYFFLGLLVSVHLVVRLRRGLDNERRGLAWLLAALLLVAIGYMTFEVGLSLEGAWLVVGTVLLVLAVVLLPAAVVVLIRAEPSWRVDLAVSRTLVGVLLTVTVVTAYVAAVWGLSVVTPWGRASAGVLVVVVLALAVLPLRDWLQRRVERLVFGSGADPSVLLGRVAQALASADTGTPLLAGLVASLRRALRLSNVEVALGGDAGPAQPGATRTRSGVSSRSTC